LGRGTRGTSSQRVEGMTHTGKNRILESSTHVHSVARFVG